MSYIIDSSGTSKVVKAHEQIFNDNGIGYITIFPISRSGGEGANWHVITTGCYALIINGRFYRVVTEIELLNELLRLQENGIYCVGILVHHIIRNDINELYSIIEKIDDVPIVYYLHDFYTCCPNPYLLRNDLTPCADRSQACDGCVYINKRDSHLKKIRRLFTLINGRVVFVAPSEYVKDKWLLFYPEYHEKTFVVPHQKREGTYLSLRDSEIQDENTPLRIAFVGAQKEIKGWDTYKKLVSNLRETYHRNYEFYYLGYGKEEIPGVKSILVQISEQGNDAMINALRDNSIDVVLLLSKCGETYSYTMYESRAANCYICTMKSSGNIAYSVSTHLWGSVLRTEEELTNLISDEETFRKRIYTWKKEVEPGPLRYLDNDEIVEFFDKDGKATIQWSKKRERMSKKAKRAILEKAFAISRLKNKTQLATVSRGNQWNKNDLTKGT